MYVYVISAGERRHKVGMAANPIDRLNQLRTGSPDDLRLEHCVEVDDARKVERMAHEMMSRWRIRGEWFDVTKNAAIGMLGAAIFNASHTDPEYEAGGYWEHEVGDRVECRNSGAPWLWAPLPLPGQFYTVSVVYPDGGIDVAEVENDDIAFCHSMFWPKSGRP